jgi:SAM-dependent methyltransferase
MPTYLTEWHYQSLQLTPTSDLYYFMYLRDAPKPLLDIGCSVGNMLSIDPEHSVGIDGDPQAVEVCSERGFSAEVVDVNGPLPFADASFGAVNARHVIEHLWEPAPFLREVYRVMRSPGRLVLVTPDFRHAFRVFYNDHTHVHPLTRESLRRLALEVGFSDFTIRHEGSRIGLRQLVRRGRLSAPSARRLYDLAYAAGIRQRKAMILIADKR